MLYQQENFCPQSSYEWHFSWWTHFGRPRTKSLFIVRVLRRDRTIAIAPFMVERHLFFRQLKFIGSGLTDFHHILINRNEIHEQILLQIFIFLSKNMKVDLINLEQVPDNRPLYFFLNCKVTPIKKREMVACPVVSFNLSPTLDTYLLSLSRKQRQGYRKKKRKLEKEGKVEFLVVTGKEALKNQLKHIFDLHVRRWHFAAKKSKFEKTTHQNFIRDFVSMSKESRAYLLLLDKQIIAYHLGFVRQKIFYDWNSSFDPVYSYCSTGLIITGLMIEDLINNKFDKLNLMRGNYDYKRKWMATDETIVNYQFLYPASPVRGKLLYSYYIKWKWILKRNRNRFLHLSLIEKMVASLFNSNGISLHF